VAWEGAPFRKPDILILLRATLSRGLIFIIEGVVVAWLKAMPFQDWEFFFRG
jgi:hypothetical protein